jgi:hypothetical protein
VPAVVAQVPAVVAQAAAVVARVPVNDSEEAVFSESSYEALRAAAMANAGFMTTIMTWMQSP